ncbi:MAG: major capsid protein [Rhodoglobus sp.]
MRRIHRYNKMGRKVRKSTPTPGDVHVNRPLTNMSVLYAQSLEKFQADNLAPIMSSENRSDSFFKFTKDAWFRDEMKERGPGTEAVEAGYGITTDSFSCIPYAVRKPISDMVRANEDTPLNSDRNAMQFVTRLERIKRERKFAAAVYNTGIWSTNKTGVAGVPVAQQFKQWNDQASTPIEDVTAWCTEMELLTGFRPNVLSMGQQVWDALKNHPDLIDRLKYGGQLQGTLSKVTKEMVAALFELDEIVVHSAIYNSAIEGATFAGGYIVGKQLLLQYRDSGAGVEGVTAVRTFTWRRYLGAANGYRIKKYRLEQYESDYVEMQSCFIHKVIAADLGLYAASVVA